MGLVPGKGSTWSRLQMCWDSMTSVCGHVWNGPEGRWQEPGHQPVSRCRNAPPATLWGVWVLAALPHVACVWG